MGEEVVTLLAAIANTILATRKTPMMPLALHAPTDKVGGLATWRTCATARTLVLRLRLLQPQRLRKPRRHLPLRKLPPRRLLLQQLLRLPPSTQRRIARKLLQRQQPQRL